jgi:HD superfamily phosphohydrolase YqeK
LKQVGGDEYVIELAKIAALLHDIALQNGDKGDHAKSGAEMTQKYLRKFDMPDDDVGLICHAIEFHTAGEEIRNNLDAAILLGDKLDVDHIRCRVVAHGAIQTYMMLIDGIKFQVGHKVATLKYSVNDKFDVNSLKVWPKAVTIPAKIAGFLGKGFVFQINDKRYTEQEFLEVVK